MARDFSETLTLDTCKHGAFVKGHMPYGMYESSDLKRTLLLTVPRLCNDSAVFSHVITTGTNLCRVIHGNMLTL